MKTETISYAVGGKQFAGELVYDDAITRPLPLLLVAPNWLGITPRAIDQAKDLAAQGFVAFVPDLFGVDGRPTGTENPMEFLAPIMSDPSILRNRMNAALDTMTSAAIERGIGNPTLRAAMGFCLGGSNVLDLARSGADLAAVVCFHGILSTPAPAAPGDVKAAVLIVHGAEDPIAGKSDRDAVEQEMTAAGARWTMLTLSGVYHSFTDRDDANRPPFTQFSAHATRYGMSVAQAFINDALTGRI